MHSFLGDIGENLDFKQQHPKSCTLQFTHFLEDFGKNLDMQQSFNFRKKQTFWNAVFFFFFFFSVSKERFSSHFPKKNKNFLDFWAQIEHFY